MLLVSRHLGERIVIAGDIEVVVQKIQRRTVKLAIRAPAGTTVLRGEVYDAIVAENRAAAAVDIDEDELLARATPGGAAPAEASEPERKAADGSRRTP